MPDPTLPDLGHIVEGVVEQDPMSDRYLVRHQLADGSWRSFDIQEALAKYKGQEIRLTVASFETIERIAALVEEGGITVEGANLRDLGASG